MLYTKLHQYSFDIQLNDLWHIRPGVHFLYTQRGIDFNKLLFNDQIHGSGTTPTIEIPSDDKIGDIDFCTSLLAYSDRIWGGFSVDHLLKPNQSLYGDEVKLPMKISVFGGYFLFWVLFLGFFCVLPPQKSSD